MFGFESEYGYAGFDSDGRPVDRGECIRRLIETARRELVHLPDMHGGRMFLRNGSCLYVDCGLHPELATPELTTPWEAVRYIKAGERMMLSIAGAIEKQPGPISKAMFFRCNVDYSGTHTTWGCHESYLHKADCGILCDQILPHLASRLIYTGAGGFDNCCPGLAFLISPRVPHLVNPVSDSSTGNRGIFHTKDEPLCGNGYHRLHVLAGESICSRTAILLKAGATALIVALIEAGIRPADSVRLRCPVTAMRQFATDPQCKARAELATGGSISAIEIQSRYLDAAEANLDRDFMPDWAPRVCEQWRAMLERLGGAPDSVATTLDWAIKLNLYRAHLARRGVAPDLLSGPQASLLPITDDRLKAAADELFAIDTKFGQLGSNGVFEAMDQAGASDDQVDGVGDIESAISQPPEAGRAHLRGECVDRLHASAGRYNCSWESILDMESGQILDLSDPWAASEQWRAIESRRKTEPRNLIAETLRLRSAARLRRLRETEQHGDQ
jgi:hypothetical protein